jgi:hypothetical protein
MVSIACQMAIASYRQQRTVRWDPATEISLNPLRLSWILEEPPPANLANLVLQYQNSHCSTKRAWHAARRGGQMRSGKSLQAQDYTRMGGLQIRGRKLSGPEGSPARQRGGHCRTVVFCRTRLARWLYLPLSPWLLPTPVTKSQPTAAEKVPAVPVRISRKSLAFPRLP